MRRGREVVVGAVMVAVAAWAAFANFEAVYHHHGWHARAHAELGDGPVEVHYAPAENLEPIDVALIDSAGETIDMTAYVLTDRQVIEALIDAGARGVRVRIWRDPTEARFTGVEQADRLAHAAGVEMRIKPGGELMHLKSYAVDGKILRTGAANFSTAGEKRQDNDIIILRDPAQAARFEANFEKIWRTSAP